MDKKLSSPLLNFNQAFDIDFSIESKDEMSNLKKKVKSEEEINLCAVNEEFNSTM